MRLVIHQLYRSGDSPGDIWGSLSPNLPTSTILSGWTTDILFEKTLITFFVRPEYRKGESALQENQTNK